MLIESGFKEILILKKLLKDLKLCAIPLQVLLVTADGAHSLFSTNNTSFNIGLYDHPNLTYDISDALVIENLPLTDKNYPIASNLCTLSKTWQI